jgi:hypothetical protein
MLQAKRGTIMATETTAGNPPSARRLAANRANAARSTGPRTPEGKVRAAQNSRKHGFAAAKFTVVRFESPQDIANLRDDLIAFYQPENSQELFAVERICLAQQSLLRCGAIESGLLTSYIDEATERPGTPLILQNPEVTAGIQVAPEQNRSFWIAEGFKRSVGNNSWALHLRYQTQAERMFRRAVEEFDRLKALRPDSPNEPIAEPEPEEITPVSPEPPPPTPQNPPRPPQNPPQTHPAPPPVAPFPANPAPPRPNDRTRQPAS